MSNMQELKRRAAEIRAQQFKMFRLECVILEDRELSFIVLTDKVQTHMPKSQLKNVQIHGDELYCDIPMWLAVKRRPVVGHVHLP